MGGVATLAGAGLPALARETAGGPWAIELFTLAGLQFPVRPPTCSSARSSRRNDIVALSYHVDYWDYIGWKDRFASHETTERQRVYAPRAETALRLHAGDGRRRHRSRSRRLRRTDRDPARRGAAPLATARHARAHAFVGRRAHGQSSPRSNSTGRPMSCSRFTTGGIRRRSTTARMAAARSRISTFVRRLEDACPLGRLGGELDGAPPIASSPSRAWPF